MSDAKTSVVILLDKNINCDNLSFYMAHAGFNNVNRELEFEGQFEETLVVNNTNIDLHFGIMHDCSELVYDYAKSLCNSIIKFPKDCNKAKAYNTLFRNCNYNYIVILTLPIFLNEGWLDDLLFYAHNTKSAGVIGISDSLEKCSYQPVLTNDDDVNFKCVFTPDNFILDNYGAFIFHRQNLYFIGAFDESKEVEGNELVQFQMRCTYNGLVNFYVPTKICILPNKPTPVPLSKFNDNIEGMIKSKRFYIPL